MLSRLKERIIRLKRWSRTRGFGVQSPTDYRFVRTVITERDCKDEDAKRHKQKDIEGKKKALYDRLHIYICQKGRTADGVCPILKTVSLTSASAQQIKDIVEHIPENSILVAEDIYKNEHTERLWKTIIDNQKARTTYDLFHLGLALFEPKITKMHYCVNL